MSEMADDPLRDLTQHSLNADEVLPRRDAHLAAAEAATFAVQMPCHNQCNRESAERVARRTANVTRWCDREVVERWVAWAWLLKEKNFRKNRWPSRSVGVGHDLAPSTSSSANPGEASVK